MTEPRFSYGSEKLRLRTEIIKTMELTTLTSFRQLALEQRWTELYEEVKEMKVRESNNLKC